MIPVIIGLAIGVGLPLQTSINSRLREAVGSPFLSSFLSFLVGTVFLAVVTVASGAPLGIHWHFFASEPWWLWLGGLFGVVYLTSNILLFPKIGSVQTVIFPVLGQIIMGLLIDNFGWFHAQTQALTLTRGLGALLVIAGVLITVALPGLVARRANKFSEAPAGRQAAKVLWLWRLLGVVAGMLSASQTAINGNLGVLLHSAIKSAFVNFTTGTIVLALVVLILHPHVTYGATKSIHRWWMWLGGFIGALFVLGNAYLAPTIGTGLAVVIVLVGLMAGSLLVDEFGWLGSRRNPVGWVQIAGLVVMIAGVALIRLV